MEIVLVGVDGSTCSREAVRWAHRYAHRVGAVLRLVTAFRYEDVVGVPGAMWPTQSFEEVHELAEATLRRVVAEAVPEDSDVTIETELVFGNPAQVLLERAATADLVVVGSRGRGGFKGLLLGSVSQQVVNHSPCPVTVVRDPG